MKHCANKDCKQNNPQPLENFWNDKSRKTGLASRCKSCKKLESKRWRESHVEERAKYQLEFKKTHKKYLQNYLADYYRENKEERKDQVYQWRKKHPTYTSEYYYANKELMSKQNREWQIANASHLAAKEAKRRSDKLQATPKWLTLEQLQEIQNIYDQCPKDYHVDHIIPLKGKSVRGLHVPWNLQILYSIDNIKKSNKL